MRTPLFPEPDGLDEIDRNAPLAERMRPRCLEEVAGQDHLLDTGKLLRQAIASDEIPSLIFWGPPGVGKTTLARIIARETGSHFVALSAVLSGIKEVRRVVAEAEEQARLHGKQTILFVDEVHRFNKAQQDAFLPHVESGRLILIGATTENPSFEVIPPLLSRARVLVLKPIGRHQLVSILKRALQDTDRGLGDWNLQAEEAALSQIALFADGDARAALNGLEVAAQLARGMTPREPVLTPTVVQEALQRRALRFDKAGEEHYNLISALHKSIRNSDADASLYWLGRMLEAGAEPLYVARRMVRFASEDVGLADPAALHQAVAAMQAVHFVGLPEGKLALAQLAVYLAQAPKSNAIYQAYGRVERDVRETENEPVPLHLRNAPTQLMKELGYGEGYRYAHHEAGGVADMVCLPPGLKDRRYYSPSRAGFEQEVLDRLETARQHRNRKR